LAKKVLVIEDDETSRFALSSLLGNAGHKVFEAATAKEAIAILYSREMPDLILLDLRLPDKGGDQFAVELHSNPLFKNIPIIVISGYLDSSATLKGVLASFEKPIDNELLLKKISEVFA
jgi:two-component system cell cycle response regulator DivK